MKDNSRVRSNLAMCVTGKNEKRKNDKNKLKHLKYV